VIWHILTAIVCGTEVIGAGDPINTERMHGDIHATIGHIDSRHAVARGGRTVGVLVFHSGRITDVDGTG